MLGAFYGLGAVFARRLGMSLADTAFFMSIVILGGVALQWPLGLLSDRFDRRRVIVATFAGAVLISVVIALAALPESLLLIAGAAFGGLGFALYPLCVAHTNDHVGPSQRVGASGGLVLAYSVGAVAGPLIGATAMSFAGPAGLFLFIAVCAGGATVFALWRQYARQPVPNELQLPYQILPRTTPMSAVLDSHAPQRARQGKSDDPHCS